MMFCGPVAQLERAPDCYSGGRLVKGPRVRDIEMDGSSGCVGEKETVGPEF